MLGLRRELRGHAAELNIVYDATRLPSPPHYSQQPRLTAADMEPEALTSGPTEKIYAPEKDEKKTEVEREGRGGEGTGRVGDPRIGTDNKRDHERQASAFGQSARGADDCHAVPRPTKRTTKQVAPVVLPV